MDEPGFLPGLQNNYIVLIHESENVLILSEPIYQRVNVYSVYEGPDRCQTLCDELYRLMMAELLIISGLSCAKKFLNF